MKAAEYRTVDKSEWGPGAWADEPDKMQFADQATGLPCLIVRGPVGALCGYVGVPPSHPLHGKNYDDVPIDAHGGLTFAGGCQSTDDPAHGICHVPDEGETDDVWWFGFDCAHAGDCWPGYAARLDLLGISIGRADGEYRSVAYVKREIRALAKQLAEVTR